MTRKILYSKSLKLVSEPNTETMISQLDYLKSILSRVCSQTSSFDKRIIPDADGKKLNGVIVNYPVDWMIFNERDFPNSFFEIYSVRNSFRKEYRLFGSFIFREEKRVLLNKVEPIEGKESETISKKETRTKKSCCTIT